MCKHLPIVKSDLIDDNAANPAGVTDPITDRVNGFTTKQYFQVLTTSLQTPIQVRDAILGTIGNPNIKPELATTQNMGFRLLYTEGSCLWFIRIV